MDISEIKSTVQELIKENLFGRKMRVQLGDKVFPALISKNTRDASTGEGEYRLTWFNYEKGLMTPHIGHMAFTKEDLDYILLNKKLPTHLTTWYVQHSLPIPQLLFEGKMLPEKYIIVGTIDHFGEIETRRGGSHKMLKLRGNQDWRYNELTERVYWHDKHNDEFERLIEGWLEERRFKVRQHITLANIDDPTAYIEMRDEAHGIFKDEQPSRKPKLQEIKTSTSNQFKSWFAGSKVVDERGNPLVVYHGTDKDFKSFDFTYAGTRDTGYYGAGMYFTPDPSYAGDYPIVHSIKTKDHDLAPGNRPTEGKRVIPVYLRLLNPFIINQGPSQLYKLVKTDKGKEITTKLKQLGYDGVIKNFGDAAGPTKVGKMAEIIAFYPNQIKSVFSAGFDANDSDIVK